MGVCLGVSRSPQGGDKRAEGETSREGDNKGLCKCKQKEKRKAVIDKTKGHVFFLFLEH